MLVFYCLGGATWGLLLVEIHNKLVRHLTNHLFSEWNSKLGGNCLYETLFQCVHSCNEN